MRTRGSRTLSCTLIVRAEPNGYTDMTFKRDDTGRVPMLTALRCWWRRGFSMIELGIVTAIGLVVVGGAIGAGSAYLTGAQQDRVINEIRLVVGAARKTAGTAGYRGTTTQFTNAIAAGLPLGMQRGVNPNRSFLIGGEDGYISMAGTPGRPAPGNGEIRASNLVGGGNTQRAWLLRIGEQGNSLDRETCVAVVQANIAGMLGVAIVDATAGGVPAYAPGTSTVIVTNDASTALDDTRTPPIGALPNAFTRRTIDGAARLEERGPQAAIACEEDDVALIFGFN